MIKVDYPKPQLNEISGGGATRWEPLHEASFRPTQGMREQIWAMQSLYGGNYSPRSSLDLNPKPQSFEAESGFPTYTYLELQCNPSLTVLMTH